MKVYFDNASTTKPSNEVVREMMQTYVTCFGNPSSLHSFGRESVALIDKARAQIAKRQKDFSLFIKLKKYVQNSENLEQYLQVTFFHIIISI